MVPTCRFVEGQLKNQKSELWLEGVKEYIKYGEALLEEFKHVKADTPGSKSLTFGANAFGTKSLQTGKHGDSWHHSSRLAGS